MGLRLSFWMHVTAEINRGTIEQRKVSIGLRDWRQFRVVQTASLHSNKFTPNTPSEAYKLFKNKIKFIMLLFQSSCINIFFVRQSSE